MSVTIDEEPLAAESLGFETIGHVLSHVQRSERLVVNLLIDGQQPDLSELKRIRSSLLKGRTLFIETSTASEMALEVLQDVQAQLQEAEASKTEAAELLQQNQVSRAMEQLTHYFSSWQAAQEAVLKTSQLLRIDLEQVVVNGQSIAQTLAQFTTQLRQTRQILTDRDFVSLSDMLLYETTENLQQWDAVLSAIADAAAVI